MKFVKLILLLCCDLVGPSGVVNIISKHLFGLLILDFKDAD
jgi:hypothetical protein